MSRKQARINGGNRKKADRGRKEKTLAFEHHRFDRQKRARQGHEPSATRKPGRKTDPGSIMRSKMEFDLVFADKEGRWSWGSERNRCKGRDPAKDGDCDVRSLLQQMSLPTWEEITRQRTGSKERRKKHHSQKLDSIVLEARKRWRDLEREEDELFRFRGDGQLRLWGFRQSATFYMIRGDPKHEIHPVEK